MVVLGDVNWWCLVVAVYVLWWCFAVVTLDDDGGCLIVLLGDVYCFVIVPGVDVC